VLDFRGGQTDGNRYLVLGLGSGQAADIAVPPEPDELIAYGPLLSDGGATRLGTAALVQATDPDTARAVLTTDRYAAIEVHNWQFGGRPSYSSDRSTGSRVSTGRTRAIRPADRRIRMLTSARSDKVRTGTAGARQQQNRS